MRGATLLVLLAAAAACGDDDGRSPEPDAGADAGQPPGDAGEPRDAAGPDGSVEPADAGRDAGPPPTDAPSKGPWTLRASPTGVVVRWESRLAPDVVAVEHEPVSGGPATTTTGSARETTVTASFGVGSRLVPEPDLPGTYFLDEVVIDGLAPATCYRYRVVGHEDAAGRFCTLHEPTDHTTPITLLVIGDTNPSIGNTAGVMEHAGLDSIEATLHLGDLQYYSSVVESWQSWFRLMRPLLSAAAFYPCVGNHESELPGELEDYYERLFGGASDDGDAHRYHWQTGGVHFLVLDTEVDLDPGTEQGDWLAAELDEAEASDGYRFSVIYFHRPPYSIGSSAGSRRVRAGLEPLLATHTVPLVMSGHAHDYQRFLVDGVTYLVSGGGGGVLERPESPSADPAELALRQAAGSYYHAVRLTIDEATLHGDVIDDAGATRDTFDLDVP